MIQYINEVILDEGITQKKFSSFINHRDCRALASTNTVAKKLPSCEHISHISRKEAIPFKGLEWFAISSVVASHWKN